MQLHAGGLFGKECTNRHDGVGVNGVDCEEGGAQGGQSPLAVEHHLAQRVDLVQCADD